jgi:segregation and condensation protein A
VERSPNPEDGFRVSLANFDGPFDLLLSLISKHEMDITEVSLAAVTGEFIEFLKDLDGPAELDAASEFLVVAATLLDMKIVGLLPAGEYADAEDVAVLEARDLLFARLLQYRAFKEVSSWFAERIERESARHPRQVRLEDKFRERTPELLWSTSAEDFQMLAMLAFAPREIPFVGLTHLHAPLVSVREQAAIVVSMLKSAPMTFRQLIAGADHKGVIVARFLAVLELYRQAAVGFEQIEPLGELTVRWTAETWTDENLVTLGADYGN